MLFDDLVRIFVSSTLLPVDRLQQEQIQWRNNKRLVEWVSSFQQSTLMMITDDHDDDDDAINTCVLSPTKQHNPNMKMIVSLDVGGTHVSTLSSTLTCIPDTMLFGMFHPSLFGPLNTRRSKSDDDDGGNDDDSSVLFIDRDGDVFVSWILPFLRSVVDADDDDSMMMYDDNTDNDHGIMQESNPSQPSDVQHITCQLLKHYWSKKDTHHHTLNQIHQESVYFGIDTLIELTQPGSVFIPVEFVDTYYKGHEKRLSIDPQTNTLTATDLSNAISPSFSVKQGQYGTFTVKLLNENKIMAIGFIPSDNVVIDEHQKQYDYTEVNTYQTLSNRGHHFIRYLNKRYEVSPPPNGKEYHPTGTLMTFTVDRTNPNNPTDVLIGMQMNGVDLTLGDDDHSHWTVSPNIDLIPFCILHPNTSFQVIPHP